MIPKVSVITVCRNARGDLVKTRDSLLSQTSNACEWIIVDGASTDGTIEILEGLEGDHIRWISEPDMGIYDAMNKGLRMATGDWVWFMNAGDTFAEDSAVSRLMPVKTDVDIVYGEVEVVDRDGKRLGTRSEVTPHRLPDRLEKEAFKYGMVVSHQAFIVNRRIAPAYKSPPYRLSADLDWMLTLLEEPRKSLNIGLIAIVTRHGATMDHWYRSQFERFLILARHFGYARASWDHFRIAMRRVRHGWRTSLWR